MKGLPSGETDRNLLGWEAEEVESGAFILYREYGEEIEMLSMEEAGAFIKAVYAYECGREAPELTGGAKLLFSIVKRRLDDNRKKYEAQCEARREAGKKGGRARARAKGADGNRQKEENEAVELNEENEAIEANEASACFACNEESKAKQTQHNTELELDLELDPEKTPPPKAPQGADGPFFARFWDAYPRKVGKGAARKAWAKLRADEGLLRAILAAVERDKSTEQWRRDGGQYIPYPATWLNQCRWEDEPEAAPDHPNEPPPPPPTPEEDNPVLLNNNTNLEDLYW